MEDLFAILAGGVGLLPSLISIKLTSRYHWMINQRNLLFNTNKGLLLYTRLPCGISSAQGIFERVMDTLLKGIQGIMVYLDDILVTGVTTEEHCQSLEEVLSRLEKAGLQAKKNKCQFMAPGVTYLGHVIDSEGLHPIPVYFFLYFFVYQALSM